MNKKVLTLCAGLLLSGSLASVYATDVTPQAFLGAINGYYLDASALNIQDGIVNFTGDVQLPNTADQATRGTMPVVILGPGCENLTFTSTSGKEFTGHIIVAAENVTIKDMKIANPLLTIQDGNTPLTQSTILAFADNVTIKDNIFTVYKPDNANNANSAKGLVLLPQSSEADYNKTITGNTFEGFDHLGSLNADQWFSSAVQVLQNTKLMQNTNIKCTGYTEAMNALSNVVKGIYPRTTPDAGELSAILKNFSTETFTTSNTISSSTVDMIVGNGNNVAEVRMNNITEDAGKVAFEKLIKDAAENAVIIVEESSLDEIQEVLSEPEFDLTGKNLTVVSEKSKANIAINTPTVTPDNGYTNVAAGEMIPTQWGKYATYKSDGKTGKVVLVWGGATVRAIKDAAGNVSYTMGAYDPNSTNGNEASQYFFTLTPYELSAGNYEVRLKDNYGNFFEVNGQYVVVENVECAEGEISYPIATELILTAGGHYVKFDWSENKFDVESNKYLAQKFGVADIQVAYMYAETLLQRYGEYFKLDIIYDKDGVNETNLTSIFAGELTPVKYTGYNAGATWYELANPKATSFMLINEKNEILALTTNPETTWSSGEYVHAYKLVTISAKEYALELDKAWKENRAPYYKVDFSFEYTPGTTPTSVGSIDAIYVDGIEIGCYLDKQVPVLAGQGSTTLKDVTISLNPSAIVNGTSWLTSPVYYTVTVKNANKKAQNYGKVLGLEEEGYVDYVAPENVDQTMPEGQFAISYEAEVKNELGNVVRPEQYRFTNRENKANNFTVRASDFYVVDMSKNLFAYRDYQYNLMDTLEIAPVKDYTSEDGFKRFTAAELNNNTYTVAMQLLNGDLLNIIENHNDKHRIGLAEDNATEWRIEMPMVKVLDTTDDFIYNAADTVTIETPITYYVAGKGWKTTTATDVKSDYYKPATALKICTYILKNTDNNEYLYGKDWTESKGNAYYVCDDTKKLATRIAFKFDGEKTVSLVPAYGRNISMTMNEDSYVSYAKGLELSFNKIIGGTTSLTGVLKDDYLYEATTNDLFVINVAEAPTYKKLAQGDKIIISRLANNDEVIYEAGEFAGIGNRVAYKDIEPTLYVDTAYVNRVGNFAYQYLLGVNISRIDTTYECNIPAHGIHKEDTTYGRFLVNMVDSAKACKDVHNNKFVYDGEYKLAFVEGYRTNDTLFFTNEAGKVVSSMKIGDTNSNITKFAFKMIDEEANEFVIETGTGYINKEVVNGNGTVEVISEATVPGYLRWVNGNLVVTTDIEKAERFTMEVSDKEATANETISAGNVVVAGVNGAVVVKGAEGKNVIVSTILGKVVANEVVSSDNAQIATPAGIVVVSVDGESFKVVVK